VVILHNATLHDNGPPYLIFGEGIGVQESFHSMPLHSSSFARNILKCYRSIYHNL
jgi:hypothetical protein